MGSGRSHARTRAWMLGVALATLISLLAASLAAARVPQGFVGVMADGPVFDPHVSFPGQLDTMVSTGVESLRVQFDWADAQPYPTWAAVPPGTAGQYVDVNGIPTRFAITDQVVEQAALRRLTVLPVVINTPSWDTVAIPPQSDLRQPLSPPLNDDPYGWYLTGLIRRYGPNGDFWRSHPGVPKVPIRMWQIWNEPSNGNSWPLQPWAPTYTQLLRVAHDAIKQADPGAKVVLAGMPNYVWRYLRQIYAIRGARKLFDVVAVHAFTNQPTGVITILQRVRAVMDRNLDKRKPILATEISWPSALGQTNQLYGFETTPAAQARNVGVVLPLLARDRRSLRLIGFDYNTWMGYEYPNAPSFNFAGLFAFKNGRILAKPAYPVFRRAALAIEGCRAKGRVATRCFRRR